ncbi:Ltp family lipoprotein [Staphylococcus hyicus]|nr:Ltp family lipoprotein [Staphylococcus hyicus]
MSKAGIYDQLTSEYGEQFPDEAAQYAIDNLDADYKKMHWKKLRLMQMRWICLKMLYMIS